MITDLEARALRTVIEATDRVTLTGELAWAVRDLLSSPYLAVSATSAGYAALREYDERNSDPAVRRRIARGMSEAASRALPPSEKGGGHG